MFRILHRKKNRREKEDTPMVDECSNGADVEQDNSPMNYRDQPDAFVSAVLDIAPREAQQQLIRGNKKRYHESLDYNLLLTKERLPDENLAFEQFIIGRRGKKKVVMAYLRDLANPDLVKEVRSRIKAIKAETLLDSSYLERNIENSNFSPFPQLEVTTQPDLTEVALLQGRVALFLDGSPDILLAPTTFFDLMDTPEDAYTRWYFASNFFRIARYIMFFMAASLPAFYIALTSHNLEMLPNRLAFRIAAGAEVTPFPVYFDAFVMMGVVEAVRLILIRIPNQIGSAIVIFAGIVLMGAGLMANIFSETLVIIVTLTAIVSFAIPNYDLRSAVRIIQFFTMIMTAMFGIFGYAVAFFYIAIHLVTLKSFGTPYMAPLAPAEASGWGHTVLRDNTVKMAQDETYEPLSKTEETGGHDE